jgi:hypothetical protein
MPTARRHRLLNVTFGPATVPWTPTPEQVDEIERRAAAGNVPWPVAPQVDELGGAVAFGRAFQPPRLTLRAVAEPRPRAGEIAGIDYVLDIDVELVAGQPARVTRTVITPPAGGLLPLAGIDRVPLRQLLGSALKYAFSRGPDGGFRFDTRLSPDSEAILRALPRRITADELSRGLALAYLAAPPRQRLAAAHTYLESRGLHQLTHKAVQRHLDGSRDRRFLDGAGQGRASVAGPRLSRV